MADLSPFLESLTVAAIFRWREATADQRPRPHLGASQIGRPCDRELWLSFRWFSHPAFDGRMLRLFERGALEEARFVRELRGIGAQVWPADPQTGSQWRVSACGGHFGGSLDAVCQGLPESSRPHVCEFKTHNAKSFAALQDKGVKVAKPEHWTQANLYAHLLGLDRILYLAACKDDDRLHAERWHVDRAAAESALNRAERIIFAWQLPARQETFACRFCDQAAACAGGPPERNCRTCQRLKPEEDGRWTCEGRPLSVSLQRLGCERWEAIGL